jgi:hypothetical protein
MWDIKFLLADVLAVDFSKLIKNSGMPRRLVAPSCRAVALAKAEASGEG